MAANGNGPIPAQCDVVVIGGGPAGSSAATHLATAGIDTVLLEREFFPRNQVGESLIPHFWKFADLTGVSEKIEREGFLAKAGGITVWNKQIRQIMFSEFGYTRPGMHIERDVFDNLLLEHAQRRGAAAFTGVAVKDADFSDRRDIRIAYSDRRGGEGAEGAVRCRYVVDASGFNTFLARQFKTRQSIRSELKFLSLWGYFENSRYVGVDRRSHAPDEVYSVRPVTFVMSHQDGWLWHIILREKTSVGLIIHTDRTKGMGRDMLERFFKETCYSSPYLRELLEPARFIDGSLQLRPDYSYYSTQICGENYYCIGDAAGFVDPIYSHGVQNALYNAAVAALAIRESLRNEKQRLRISQLCASRIQQFYGFSRALALGDFGGDGVNGALVKTLIKSIAPLELELMLAASEITDRSENFRRLVADAGLLEAFERGHKGSRTHALEELRL
jgi:flavin-dependent dehydrogenase